VPASSYVSVFRVIETHPHCAGAASGRCTAFTEGLSFDAEGNLYESTGGYGNGNIRGVRVLNLTSGATVGEQMLPASGQFAEGLTVLPDNRLLQLTYRENQVNEYRATGDPPALEHVRTASVRFGQEGWGLTRSLDGSVLYVTDSTDVLLHVNASTLQVMRRVPIVDPRMGSSGRHIYGVNELELVGHEVWGNVYPTCGTPRTLCDHSECIVRIDPASGNVRGWVDFTALLDREPRSVRADIQNAVFNGIAYHADSDRLLVTGKNWDSIYRVAIEPSSQSDPSHVASVCRLAA